MGDVADEWGIDMLITASPCPHCEELIDSGSEECSECGEKTGWKSTTTIYRENGYGYGHPEEDASK